MTINERLFATMQNKNKKYNELADYLKINKSIISAWKKRGTNPPSEYIVDICKFLEVTTDYLLGNENTEYTIEEQQIIDRYRQLDEESKQAFRTLLHVRLTNQENTGKSSEYKIG